MRYRLFVYGTLKKGYINHHLLKKSKFIGKAITKDKFPLIKAKTYPYLIYKNEGFNVEGELYEIDLPTLKRVDRLEEYPKYYKRELISVISDEGIEYEAYCYFLNIKIPYKKFRFLKRF